MAYAVMSPVDDNRATTVLAAHLPSAALPEILYFRAFDDTYTHAPVTLTTEARRKFLIQRINMTDVVPTVVQQYYDVAASLAKDNHPMIRVIKECGLHKEMLFSTPVFNNNTKQIAGVLLAHDDIPDDLCPSPGHLVQQQKTGFLTSLCSPGSPLSSTSSPKRNSSGLLRLLSISTKSAA